MRPVLPSSFLSCVRPVLVALVLAATQAACGPPPPGVRVLLRVPESGPMTLAERAMGPDELPAALAQARLQAPDLFVEVVASPRADAARITRAVEALKASGARFAFIDEALMKAALAASAAPGAGPR